MEIDVATLVCVLYRMKYAKGKYFMLGLVALTGDHCIVLTFLLL